MSNENEQEPGQPATPMPGMFRREAIEYHADAQGEASLLQITGGWVRWTYRFLIIACLISAVYSVVGRVNEYASGTAVIQSEGRIDVSAHVAGTVEGVAVRPGERVAAGQPLIRLYAGEQAAGLERIENEIEQHLLSLLRDPGDGAARAALASLRAQRDFARARIEEHVFRAPQAGVVSHVGIRAGQRVEQGDVVLSLTSEQVGFRVLAVLPGQYRPLLQRGMPLRLELQGFPYAYQTVTIDAVSDEVVGPAEVRRYLPQSIASAFDPVGPLVFVEARLPGRSFEVSGRSLGFYDGMLAGAEVVVRSERIFITLIPGLRALM